MTNISYPLKKRERSAIRAAIVKKLAKKYKCSESYVRRVLKGFCDNQELIESMQKDYKIIADRFETALNDNSKTETETEKV